VKSLAGQKPDLHARRRDELHPRINPITQKVATGDLFGYVALESGQYFMGEIWCENNEVWQALCELTGVLKSQEAFKLRLGKATRRGYGLSTLWVEEITATHPWRVLPMDKRVTDVPTSPFIVLTMTLLTDAIIPDQWGRSRQTLNDPGWLENFLNAHADFGKSFQLSCTCKLTACF
jgi:CRISPR-associated protein Csx10